MSKRMPVVAGSLFILAYVLILFFTKGFTVLADWVQTGALNHGSSWTIRYPYIVDVGFLILAWVVIWRFVHMIINVQMRLVKTGQSPYLDIYLIAVYAAFTLVVAYWMVDNGFGLGASGLASFSLAYLVCSLVFSLYQKRIRA